MRVERTARVSRLIKEGAVRTDKRYTVTRVCAVLALLLQPLLPSSLAAQRTRSSPGVFEHHHQNLM